MGNIAKECRSYAAGYAAGRSPTRAVAAEVLHDAADEIDRLRKTLADHGINPDSEYIAPGGLRVDPPASKSPVEF